MVNAAAIKKLRDSLYSNMPFIDVPNTWTISILVEEALGNRLEIAVIHSMQATTGDPDGERILFNWKSQIVWYTSR